MDNLTCAVVGCDSPTREDSYCWHHWARWTAFGDPLETRRLYRQPQKVRVLDLVAENLSTGCWEWRGAKDRDGYGLCHFGDITTGAHRAVWMTLVGPIEAESLDHLCRNRSCVNPAHLEPVSMKVNTSRGDTMAARFAKRTHCNHGHEFTPENTIIRPEDGSRACRECRRRAGRISQAKRRAAGKA